VFLYVALLAWSLTMIGLGRHVVTTLFFAALANSHRYRNQCNLAR
jgi:hypothetical protein